MADTKYCLCCGVDVLYNYVEREDRTEITCAFCGFTLDIEKLTKTPDVREGYVLVTDDSKNVRDIIVNALKSTNIYKNIMTFENGLELTTSFSYLVSRSTPIDVAIIDLIMPIMDGFTAAKTLRTIEFQYKVSATPIIFFSAVQADDSFREKMELLSPAIYLNKGADPEPESLARRVEQLVGLVTQKDRSDTFH
ncbi:MAG TPA: response regulator [Thermodesulfovibrionales bacterium]|nr:response regulator [Thermodesulfovibrionales bacterium]